MVARTVAVRATRHQRAPRGSRPDHARSPVNTIAIHTNFTEMRGVARGGGLAAVLAACAVSAAAGTLAAPTAARRERTGARRAAAALPGARRRRRGAGASGTGATARRGWYDARLGDRERYPLATIWDIVPLFESLDAIAIASTDAGPPRGGRDASRAGAERYLNRGLRPLPGYSPYPGDRDAATADVVRRQRLVGPRVRQRLSRDRLAALPRRRAARAALHRGGRLGPRRRRHLVEHRATPTRPARRSPRRRCWRRCSTSRPTPPSRSAQARRFLAWADTSRLQRQPTACTRRATSSPTPIDYIEGPLIYAQAVLCHAAGTTGRMRTRRAAQGAPRSALRLPARLLAAVRRDLPAVDARALRARRRPRALPLAADNAREAQAHARDERGPVPALVERPDAAGALRAAGMLQTQAATTQPVRVAGGVPAAAVTRGRRGAQTPSARRATRSKTWSGSSRRAISIARASRPTR